jgi:hypothetical protein
VRGFEGPSIRSSHPRLKSPTRLSLAGSLDVAVAEGLLPTGGLINVYVELHGYDRARALALTREIHSHLREVFAVAHDLGIPTSVAADRIVEQRLAQGRREGITVDASAVKASGRVATSIAGVVAQPH